MARSWLQFYPQNARADIDQPPFSHLSDLVRDGARQYGGQIAFTTVMPNGISGDLTFSEVDRLSDCFAAYLREYLKLKPGDRVALQVPNGLSFPVVAFGIFKADCVLVNINPLYTGTEMGYQLSDAKPQALVIINMFADKLPRALSDYHIPHIILVSAAELFPPAKRLLIGFVQRFIKRQIPSCTVTATNFAKTLRLGSKYLSKGGRISGYISNEGGGQPACLQYTGGTTGVAKGAMLSHRNLIMNIAQTVEMVGGNVRRGEEILLTVLPLYHIFAFTINFLSFYWVGARNILIPNPRPLSNLRKALENYPISWIVGVNTLFNGLNNSKWFSRNPPHSLKNAIAGGMALQSGVAKRWQEITGLNIIEGYGLTETSPVVTFNPFDAPRAGTIGIPIPSTAVRCLDDSGNDVQQGEPGELVVKGPQVMMGYWHRPQETANVLKDGWLLTGDIAVIDTDGYVRIVDRKKDMILHSGFNIYPNEVEDCLVKHPDIIEAAVIGVPDGAAGEAVKAFIVRRIESLSADEVRGFCKSQLTAYKVPKYVEFRDELPKTNVGKILRKALRDKEAAAY